MPRTKIPGHVVDSIRVQSADRCCVCERRGQHIHHLNGDATDHDFDNLALLCFGCHDRATRGHGLGHGLGARTIRAFRSKWYSLLAERAARFARRPIKQRVRHTSEDNDLPNALLAHEVRKLRWAIARDGGPSRENWPAVATHIGMLWEYAREGNPRVQDEVIEAVSEAVSRTRYGMHFEAAEKATGVLSELTPLPHRRPAGWPTDVRENKVRIERILSIAWNLAYDAILYNENLAIADAALEILKWIYRYAEVNKVKDIQAIALGKFTNLQETAKRAKWKEAEELVTHELGNAPKVGTGWEDSPPDNVEQLIRKHRDLQPGRRIDRTSKK